MLLVGRDLDVVWPDSRLDCGGVIETFDIVEIRDIESGNVVCGGQSEICESAVLGDVGARTLLDVICCLKRGSKRTRLQQCHEPWDQGHTAAQRRLVCRLNRCGKDR